MKLNSRAAALLACTFACSVVFVGCGDDETNENVGDGGAPGDGDGDKTGDGDGDKPGDGDGDVTGDGDDDPVGLKCDEAGGSQCTGTASGIVCPKGSKDSVPFSCAVGDVCDDGACIGQCEAGATECVGGSVVRVCANNGREWVNIPCQQGEICEDGACSGEETMVCIPGAKSCDGNTARTCLSDGSGWDEIACPGTTTCEDGMCSGSVCTIGDTKCDESTHLSAALFEGAGEPNFSVIHRCVDGESWVVESCLSDEETVRYCNYDGFSRSEAARYRQEVNLWFFSNFFEGPPDITSFPTSPQVPKGVTASCKEAPQADNCNEVFDVFFETPAMSRQCVDLDDPEEGSKVWTGYTECQGFPPFAPLQLVENSCDGLSVCGEFEPTRGCVPSECIPGESMCGDDEANNSYGVCFYEGYDAHFNFYGSCPDTDGAGGAGPGECSDAGQAPTRQASCDGVEVNDG